MDFEIVLFNSSNQDFMEKFDTIIHFSVLPKKTHEQPHAGRIAFCISLFVMLETIGNFLLYSMIMYEKYGMDPQKRTLTNQLFSVMLIIQVLVNIFIMPLFVVNYFNGFQSKFYLMIFNSMLILGTTNFISLKAGVHIAQDGSGLLKYT